MLSVTYMPFIAECRYDECRYAECRYAECRVAQFWDSSSFFAICKHLCCRILFYFNF
jgi:hypothetical protein